MSDEIEIAEGGASYLTALLTVIGFALYWAAVCALLFSGAFSAGGVSPMDGYLLRALFLVGFCVMQLLSSTALPDALDTRRRRATVRIAVCVIAAALAALAMTPAPAAPFVLQAALWLALALNGLVLGVDAAFPTALVGIGAGGLAALVVIALRGATPAASSVERITFPVFGACLLALPFTPGTNAFQAVMALLVADLSAYLVFHWNVLVLLAYRKRLKPVYHFGQGLISTATAIAIGWAAIAAGTLVFGGDMAGYGAEGWGLAGVPAALAGNLASLTLVGCLGAVLALVVVLSVVPYASNRAVEDLFTRTGGPDVSGPAAEPQPDSWETACGAICDERGLTPREREVFAYLARGRNADHIAGELFISVHTAKTHTARIYRKLGINSQQQLIDIVESRIAQG